MLDMRYNQTLNGTVGRDGNVNATSWFTAIAASSGVLCRTNLSMGHINVTRSLDQAQASVTMSDMVVDPDLKLETVTNSQMWDLISRQLIAGDSMFGQGSAYNNVEDPPDALFSPMSALAGGGYDSLLDAVAMIKAAETTFQTLAVQAISSMYRVQNTSTISGHLLIAQERMLINSVSVWLMVAGFIVGTACAIGLIFTCKDFNQISDEDPLSELALLVSARKNTRPIFTDYLTEGEGSMQKKFAEYRVMTTLEKEDVDGVYFTLKRSHPLPRSKSDLKIKPQPWWVPVTVAPSVLGICLVLPPLSIILLEALQVLSDRRSGFAAMMEWSILFDAFCTHYMPTIFLLLVATLFNCLDFNALLIAPYDTLRAGVPGRSLRSQNLIGIFPLLALWRSAKTRSFGAFFSSLAAFAGSILTIVVSGLFTIQIVNFPVSGPIQRLDQFNPDWIGSATNDSGAAVLSSLMENLDFTYPAFTYDEIAIPSLQNPSGLRLVQNVISDTRIEVQVPVLRASLNCTEVKFPLSNASISADRIQQHILFQITYPLPPSCQFGGADGNSSVLNFASSIDVPSNESTIFVGRQLDLHMGPYDPVFGSPTDEASPGDNPDNPPGCPSLAFVYGVVNMSASGEDAMKSVSCQVCYQGVQEIPTNITFLNEDFVVGGQYPPLPNESMGRYLTINNTSETAFQHRIQGHMTDSFALFNASSGNPYNFDTFGDQPPLDTFFQGVLFGSKPLPMDTLELDTDDKRLQILSGIQSFYRRYMAQAISTNMRVPPATNASSTENRAVSQYIATMPAGRNERRIIQHRAPKTILQSLLAFMFICGCIAVKCTSFSEVLPAAANPCTIWGRTMLWAGSEFCDGEAHRSTKQVPRVDKKELHSTTTELTDHETDESPDRFGEAADDLTFKLSWWAKRGEDGHVRLRYGIDAVPDEEEAHSESRHCSTV